MSLALRIGAVLVEKGTAIWQDPKEALSLATQGTAFAAEIAKLALMAQDSPTRFKGTPGVAKRAAWAEPISLTAVKAAGKAAKASVNDVLMSCAAGALRSYLADQGDPVRGVTIRALIPVNLRPLEKAHQLGNQFGLVFLDLPLGIEHPLRRLAAVRANMDALKASYQPVLSMGLLAAMGAGPKILQDQLLTALARNATAVMTNVPGPQQPLYLAGAEVDSLMVWVPQSGDIGLGMSILSYNGQVQFGLVADRGFCPDPGHITSRFAPEFEKLEAALSRRKAARKRR
jgi:diacylglycerol O-acyltransferase